MAAAEKVLVHVHGLYKDTANTQAHSQWLEQFQQTPHAWAVAHELLTQNAQPNEVHFFAAQTLVTKLQAGQLPPTGSVRQELMRYLSIFWRSTPTVRKQLVIALVDNALWQQPCEDGQWLLDTIKQFSEGGEATIPCMLEFLMVIPEEAASRRVVVSAQRRSAFASNMLQHTGVILDVLSKAAQAGEALAVIALRTLARWLRLQHADPALRAQKKSTGSSVQGKFTAVIIAKYQLHEHPLLKQAAQTLGKIATANLELCRACAEALSEVHQLTNDVTIPARAATELVIEAVVTGSHGLLPMTQVNLETWMEQDGELAQRTGVLAGLVSELGGPFARLVFAADKGLEMTPVQHSPMLLALAEVVHHLCTLRHTDLAKSGLDFWYSVFAQHLGANAEEDDPFDDEAQVAAMRVGLDNWPQSRDPDAETQRRADERPILQPFIEKMVKSHWRAVRFPGEPEMEQHFDWDEFARFREFCSFNITEACLVVTPRWIIDHMGTLLEQICSSQTINWQDIDACVFVLTGVASRAPAGQDTVIPKLIELLPQLPYNDTGFKALLFRNAASRLILFTSGYLALHPEPCKSILRFLTKEHLPKIPSLPAGPDPDAKKYCQAIACDATKMVMTAARKGIVSADNGTFWKEVVSNVITLVADPRFNVDCRAQLVFAIGQVLSVLEDWGELEHMLDIFVTKMQEPLAGILQNLPAEPLGSRAQKMTSDGKAPTGLKLYIAAISSVYNMPARTEALPRPAYHPVLAVVEKHFAMIERVCIHHTQYDELMEQVCLAFSYILGFAREYAATSPIFVPMMKLMGRCCEQHPQPFYMMLVRSVIGFFAAAAGNDELDSILVDLTGLFSAPIAQALVAGSPLPPPINAASYEMLSEALRHWNLAYLAIRRAQWLPETLDATLEALPVLAEQNQAVHERTVCAMLRFIRNVLLWADPETSKGDTSPELVALQQTAQATIAETPLKRGVALPRLVEAFSRLLAAAASNGPSKGEVVPSLAEVLRTLLSGPFEYEATSNLPAALRALPGPMGEALGEADLQRLIQQLKMDKVDSRRFIRTVLGVAEQFSVALKRAQLGG